MDTTLLLSELIFVGPLVALLGLDLYFHRKHPQQTFRQAVLWTMAWVSLAFFFNLYIYWAHGAASALSFLTGYVIEQSLSVDNLFVIMLIMGYFSISKADEHRVLFWGVVGAFLMRGVVILAGVSLINHFSWITIVFGAFLIITGIKSALQSRASEDPAGTKLLQFIQKRVPLKPIYLAILVIEITDLVFAIDSIPAILAITQDPFIVVTSNLFAILGLRSMYFVLNHFLKYFHYLRYGLGGILAFVGSKMMLAHYIEIPTLLSLMVIFFILAITILASWAFPPPKKTT